jgi:cell division GTPase FtsZ
MSNTSIIGLGGCGSNIITRINKNFDFNFKIIDTNKKSLENTSLDKSNILNLGNGRGSGMSPQVALELAQKKESDILEFIKKPELLFLIAGVGGTGNGLMDYLSKLTLSKGILPVAYIIKPNSLENDRIHHFNILLNKFKQNNYSYTIIDSIKITEKYGGLSPLELYSQADTIINSSLETIQNLEKSSCGIDFNDIKKILSYKGFFLANTVKAKTWQEAFSKVIDPELLDFELKSYDGMIIRISGKELPEYSKIEKAIMEQQKYKSESGHFKIGFEKTEYDGIQVDLILTGINSQTL